MRRLLPAWILVIGLAARAQDPSLVPTDLPRPVVEPSANNGANPGESPGPQPQALPEPTADAQYEAIIELVVAGQYDEAIRQSMRGIGRFPGEERFSAAARLALDARNLASRAPLEAPVAAPGPVLVPTQPTYLNSYPGYPYKIPKSARRAEHAVGRPSGGAVGFDLGLITGLRLEYRTAGPGVDSVGLRVGTGIGVYYGLYPAVDFMGFVDFQSPTDWQSELLFGVSVMEGTALPNIGFARQWDPPTPEQVSIGARVGRYGSVAPEISFGFVW